MNEHKVRLIADQATEWCKQHAHGAPTAWEWETKFAELIVKECANLIKSKAGQVDDMRPIGVFQEKVMNEDANLILKHFGIEK